MHALMSPSTDGPGHKSAPSPLRPPRLWLAWRGVQTPPPRTPVPERPTPLPPEMPQPLPPIGEPPPLENPIPMREPPATLPPLF